MKSTKNFIIGALLVVIISMAVGYSAFASELELEGTAEIIGEWDVRIINIEAQNISEGCDCGEPQFTNTSATFNAKLVKPGDSITYVITIKNAGIIDATLSNVICKEVENGSPAISYSMSELDNDLKAGEQTMYTIKVLYDPNSSEVPSIKSKSITSTIEYSQKS